MTGSSPSSLNRFAFRMFRKALPRLSRTERDAIEAGTVWWERELFSGRPDWNSLGSIGVPELTREEQAFLDGPVEELCGMVDQWKVNHELADVPAHIVDFIKAHRFLGMIIPNEYGGLGFSPLAQSEVLCRMGSVGAVVGNLVVLPNSLGPAELILKYGTLEQKRQYLPRLARGEDIPCFALTSPSAGSDATAIPDTGVVCTGEWNGREVTGLRLDFDKRYITLAPVATLVGLAFHLQDPEHLLGDADDYGITCALVPGSAPGLEIGRRHLPLGEPFLNGPVRGRNVFVPLDAIIGGPAMAGKGWRMLVECLSAGRGIGVPATATSMAKRCVAAAGAYARIRRQFNTSIADFEGIQQPLARIAGLTSIMEAARIQTAQAVTAGHKPSVASAIIKYHCTEMARQVVNDAMDIHGGKAVMRGPGNYLAPIYEAIPVPITVEGANILTRSLIIFGQGAIRAHPYILREIELAAGDETTATVKSFNRIVLRHGRHVVAVAARAFMHGLSRSLSAPAPPSAPPALCRHYRHLNRLSAVFALTAEATMLAMGAALKRREMISGRLADLLSMLYLASVTLKNYQDRDCPEEELPLVNWSCAWLFNRFETSLFELLENFPRKSAATLLRLLTFPAGRQFRKPSDELGRRIAGLISHDTPVRRKLVEGVFLTPGEHNPLGSLDNLLGEADALECVYHRLRSRGKDMQGDGAEVAGVLAEEEAQRLRAYEERVARCTQVDDFEFQAAGRVRG